MPLSVSYDKEDDIPSEPINPRDLYAQKNNKWELNIPGLKTDADVAQVKSTLDLEKKDHKKTKERFRALSFNGKSIIEMSEDEFKQVVETFDGYDELKMKAENAGKVDEEKINQLVEGRINRRLNPVEREKAQLATEKAALAEQVAIFEQKERQRTIHETARKAAVKANIKDESIIEDVLGYAERHLEVTEDGSVLTKENAGVTPRVEADSWLNEMLPRKQHWLPLSQGGGAGGSKPNGGGFADNPFTAANWNMTKQGLVVETQGMDKAQQMARAAGTTVGGPRPAAKS